jgi:hypothetical protein
LLVGDFSSGQGRPEAFKGVSSASAMPLRMKSMH